MELLGCLTICCLFLVRGISTDLTISERLEANDIRPYKKNCTSGIVREKEYDMFSQFSMFLNMKNKSAFQTSNDFFLYRKN